MQKWSLLIVTSLLCLPGCDASSDAKTLLLKTEAAYQTLEDCVMQAKRIDRTEKEGLESNLVSAMFETLKTKDGSEIAVRTEALVDAVVASCNEEKEILEDLLLQMDAEAAPAAIAQINENLAKMLHAALSLGWVDSVIDTVERIQEEGAGQR